MSVVNHQCQNDQSCCLVCSSPYDAQIHVPRMLPGCMHTFCESCLKQHEIEQKTNYIKTCLQGLVKDSLEVTFECPLCSHAVVCEDKHTRNLASVDFNKVLAFSIVRQFERNETALANAITSKYAPS